MLNSHWTAIRSTLTEDNAIHGNVSANLEKQIVETVFKESATFNDHFPRGSWHLGQENVINKINLDASFAYRVVPREDDDDQIADITRLVHVASCQCVYQAPTVHGGCVVLARVWRVNLIRQTAVRVTALSFGEIPNRVLR